MKNLKYFIAFFMLSLVFNVSAQKQLTTTDSKNPYDNIGVLHNDILDYISNKKINAKEGKIDFLSLQDDYLKSKGVSYKFSSNLLRKENNTLTSDFMKSSNKSDFLKSRKILSDNGVKIFIELVI